MPVTLKFQKPSNYNLSFYEIGQSTGETEALTLVASGTDIGTFPNWISSLNYSGDNTFWYAVRFGTDDGGYTAWTDRMYGRYGTSYSYFIVHPSGSQWVYLVPPQTSGVVPSWLEMNKEYTVTIDSSGLYASGTNYMVEDYEFSFTSTFCPLWSTVDSVRLTVGPLINNLPDDTINRMINKASYQAMSLFLSGSNPYGCDYTTIPEPLYRWVTCAAGLMALNAAISSNSGFGNTSKRLGQFDVKYDATAGVKPSDIRKDLNDCLQTSSLSLQSILGSLSTFAVKSINNTYIKHPMMDEQWGRHPRKVNELIDGPWLRASNDIATYQDASIFTDINATPEI